MNFVVCRNGQGLNGWQDTPEVRAHFEELVDSVNNLYAAPRTQGYSLSCPVSYYPVQDTHIRFKLKNVYFLNSDDWNLDATGAYASAILSYLFTNHPEAEQAMNHIFTQPGTWPGGYWGFYSNLTVPGHGRHSYVFTRNSMWGDNPVWADHIDHLQHEYGHAVGLHHTYDGPEAGSGRSITHFDFLDDVFGTCPEAAMSNSTSPCYNGCAPQPSYVCHLTSCFFSQFPASRPLMCSGGSADFISPKQSGRMHRALSLYNNSFTVDNRPMQQYVEEKYSYGTYRVTTDETWDFSMKMYQDIQVDAPNTLTLKCELQMPIDGIILVRPGAKLIIDGGVVTCAHEGELWHGIMAEGITYKHQEPANHPTYQGLVVMKNGGLVEHAKVGFANHRWGGTWYRGGVLQVQGTLQDVGGTFRNCTIGAEFEKYSNYYPTSPSHATKNDNSYFKHAEFIVDDNYRGGDDFDAHVRMWEVKGISFQQCDFINAMTSTAPNIKASHTRGKGIYSIDATYSVTGQCTESLPLCEYGSGQPEPVCPEAALRPSRFIGLDHGIRAGSGGVGGYTFTVKDSYFENNVCGIFDEAVDNAGILHNKFVVGGREAELT